jgi:hypothetical protein
VVFCFYFFFLLRMGSKFPILVLLFKSGNFTRAYAQILCIFQKWIDDPKRRLRRPIFYLIRTFSGTYYQVDDKIPPLFEKYDKVPPLQRQILTHRSGTNFSMEACFQLGQNGAPVLCRRSTQPKHDQNPTKLIIHSPIHPT